MRDKAKKNLPKGKTTFNAGPASAPRSELQKLQKKIDELTLVKEALYQENQLVLKLLIDHEKAERKKYKEQYEERIRKFETGLNSPSYTNPVGFKNCPGCTTTQCPFADRPMDYRKRICLLYTERLNETISEKDSINEKYQKPIFSKRKKPIKLICINASIIQKPDEDGNLISRTGTGLELYETYTSPGVYTREAGSQCYWINELPMEDKGRLIERFIVYK